MQINTKEIEAKKKLLNNAEKILKEEYVGIDPIIEQVINNMRTWYLFPQLIDKPIVINLFGMTGCGKTSLVKRLMQLLDIEKDMVYFNFAQISENTNWEVKEMFDNEVPIDKSNIVFVYDEFQYAATKSQDGEEKDNRSGLKTFWELLDDGILKKRMSYYDARYFGSLITWCDRLMNNCDIKLVNGEWVNAEECLKAFDTASISEIKEYFNIDDKNEKLNKIEQYDYDDECSLPTPWRCDLGKFFLNVSTLKRLYGFVAYQSKIDKRFETFSDFVAYFTDKDVEGIFDIIYKIVTESIKGITMNYKNCLIFVLANIDEAYTMSYDVDPDMSPDQFHEITKKISIVDIKSSLQRRFRNEQISRLGNIMITYPSFTTEDFRCIIRMDIDRYANAIKSTYDILVTYDQSIVDIIYNDSVFPTQGTRPVFSSTYEIVKTKFAKIVEYAEDRGIDLKRINFKYENNHTVIELYNEPLYIDEPDKYAPVDCIEFTEVLRTDNLRKEKNNDEQAITAVHESGHFVMYAKLYGKMPEKLYSRTASSNTEGFMLWEINLDNNTTDTKTALMDRIRVALGGYMAEKIVFGTEYRTAGSQSDLMEATKLASAMIRRYGLGANGYTTTYLKTEPVTNGGLLINDPSNEISVNTEIKNIIKTCENDVRRTFESEEWRNMLVSSASYLTKHTNMPKDVMQKLYEEIPETIRERSINVSHKDGFFLNKVKELAENTDKMTVKQQWHGIS